MANRNLVRAKIALILYEKWFWLYYSFEKWLHIYTPKNESKS